MRKYIGGALLCFATLMTNAQGLINFDSEAIEQDFITNLNLYSQYYTAPVLGTFSFGQINAWQSNARILEPWSFHIEIVTSAAFAPDEALTFNFNEVGFTDKLTLKNPSNTTLVSALGGETDQVFLYEVTADNGTSYSQEIPAFGGFSSPFNAIPNAVPQVSIGLPGHTQVSVRLMPYISIDGVTHSEYGLGVQHNLGKYFLDNDDISLNIGAFYDLNQFNYEPNSLLEGEDQNIGLQSQALLLDVNASYAFHFIDLFASLGYYSMFNQFDISGTYRYEVRTGGVLGQDVVREAFSTEDPIHISENISGLRFSSGLNFRLGKVVNLNVGYHFARINTLSAGLGFTIGQTP